MNEKIAKLLHEHLYVTSDDPEVSWENLPARYKNVYLRVAEDIIKLKELENNT